LDEMGYDVHHPITHRFVELANAARLTKKNHQDKHNGSPLGLAEEDTIVDFRVIPQEL
jgi:hypothetical protein